MRYRCKALVDFKETKEYGSRKQSERIMRRPIKWVIAFIAWMVSSAAIVAFIRSFSKAAWADILGVAAFFVLGIVIAWIATKIKTYS